MQPKKTQLPYELLLFYAIGLKPKDMINMGYSPKTVYRYNVHYKRATESVRVKLANRGVTNGS